MPEMPADSDQLTEPAVHNSPRRAGRQPSGLRVLAIVALAAIALVGALIAGTLPRLRQQQAVSDAAASVAAALPRVTVAVVQQATADPERVLPGNSLPLLEASIYARTSGYLKSRRVDIGDRVTQGMLLAEIASPDIDAQLAQARAGLAQAQANLPLAEANAELAKSTLARDTRSGPGTATSWGQIDQDRAQVKVTAAQVAAARASIQVNEATVQRFVELQGFQKITAPFPGVITARNVDPGDLISADTPNSTRELFHLMRTDVLRVLVNVPQVFATGIKVGQNASVYLRDEPAKQHRAKVTRTAEALDPNTRTLLTEVDVPNADNDLRPGMYLQVKFVFDQSVMPVMIPAAALATRSGAPRVAVLDGQSRVQYRTVQLARDFGTEIEVVAGLKAGETVVTHPGDDIPEGTAVEAISLAK
jgi:RND family efflux transporter MFP subunit